MECGICCASPLLVHVVTPPSQEGSERITFISQYSNTSPGSLETALLGYQISQMECDLPSVKHKNFLIRIVRNLSFRYFEKKKIEFLFINQGNIFDNDYP